MRELQLLESRVLAWQAAARQEAVASAMAEVYARRHLRAIREHAGLSLREVARRADVSPTTVSLMERNALLAGFGPDALGRVVAVLRAAAPNCDWNANAARSGAALTENDHA